MELAKSIFETNSCQTTSVDEPLLKDLQGEVLLIRSAQGITVCSRNAGNIKALTPSWMVKLSSPKATFIAGEISEKGGRFEFIGKSRAIEIIAEWVFEQIESCFECQELQR